MVSRSQRLKFYPSKMHKTKSMQRGKMRIFAELRSVVKLKKEIFKKFFRTSQSWIGKA